MFIRKKQKKDKVTGCKYFSYQLVESVRTERGPRQRILLDLGNELDLSDENKKLLANRIEELLAGIQSLFPYPPAVEQLAQTFTKQIIKKGANKTLEKSLPKREPEYHSVNLDSLEHSQSRTIGIEYIAYETIKKLELEQKLLEIGFTKRQIEIAIGVIIGRLTCPGSELATYDWIQNMSAVDELLDTDFSRLSLDSIYRIGDLLLKNKDAIEEHLICKERTLFTFKNTIILYDLTNTYFEGTAKGISHASRGHSKERRSDCPLVTMGLVLNSYGFPIRSKMLPGNISEPSTLQDAITELSCSFDDKPVIVIDAGIATEDNLDYLRKEGYCYVVSSRRRSCEFPEDLSFDIVKKTKNCTVKAAQKKDPETEETILYCHSTDREKKEKAMHSLLHTRLEQDLQKASDALTKKRGTKAYSKVMERIGRIKEKHRRIASYYDIEVKADETSKIAISITWKEKEQKLDNRFQGGYILRVHGLDWSTEKLWKTYTMLTEVEEGFRCLKGELGLRPVFHQIGPRVDAHLFITLLSYHVMQTILYQLKLSGISLRWTTLQRRMSTQTRITTTMQLQKGQTVHTRISTRPESFHREIYKALNLSSQPSQRIKTFT